jgi:hypothetical protein
MLKNLHYLKKVMLRKAGILKLGMDDRLSVEIGFKRGAGPKKTNATMAFHFWNWVAMRVEFGETYPR